MSSVAVGTLEDDKDPVRYKHEGGGSDAVVVPAKLLFHPSNEETEEGGDYCD